MITVLNPDRLTRQPFFIDLINYLDTHDEVILRQIKRDFPHVDKLDRQLEDYVRAGYIRRHNRRYDNDFALLNLSDIPQLKLDSQVFVRQASEAEVALNDLTFTVKLENVTNEAIICEQVDFKRESLTLSNYFYKLRHQYPLSQAQQALYALLGDVNVDYAMKYITTTLIKFTKKEVVMQKRPDIFVSALVELGYLVPDDTDFKYRLDMTLDKEKLVFKAN